MSAQQSQPPGILDQVMQADRFRLRRAWQRLQAQSQPDTTQLNKWQARAEASARTRAARAASIPPLSFDPELPITAHREEITALLHSHQTIVVCGETGSGKSTQLPKLCLDAGFGVGGMIGHTQPRRLAARAVSNRLADELGTKVGEKVGFKIRFTDTTKPESLVKLMTDGVLLAETQSDRFLDQYDVLIIDEAHERSLNIDFLLGYLRNISSKRPNLKLIITSATIDPQRFANHFAGEQGPAPIVEVSGRTYPVELRYRDHLDESDTVEMDDQQLAAIADAADELMAEGPGDILVFLPTERDIRLASKHLRGHFTRVGGKVDILPLYARLSNAEQNKIFAAHSSRRIILSTNVAESSLTVPGIHYVIDTGLVRISRYAPRSKVRRLPIEGVSQASANQRSGRCGRLGPGICIRLFSKTDFESRSRYTTPEIRRSDLASVLLQSKTLRLGPLEEFPLLDPPSAEAMRDAVRSLREIGAINESSELTKIGKQLGRLPCEPRIGRMLLEADERNCLAEVIIVAAAIEVQDVRQRPAGQRPQADEAHAKFADPHSDFLSYLRLWDFYAALRSDLGRSRLQKALSQSFLSYQGFREWADVVRQLKDILADAGIKAGQRRFKLPKLDPKLAEDNQEPNNGGKSSGRPKTKLKRPEGYSAMHQSLLSGLLSGIAQRGDRHDYKAIGGLSVSIWPGSGQFSRKPKWIMAAEIVETSKRYGRTIAEIDSEWIEKAGATLLKHSYSDPHWSSKSGAAMVYRKSTLYGLPIVVGRRVQLAPIDRDAARDMLIEHGLVAGEWICREAFYKHNQELLADMHELAQRTRSRDYILDRFHIGNFYTARLPKEIHDLGTLRSWLKKNAGSSEEKSLWMQQEDLLADTSHEHTIENGFPNALKVGSTELPLEYHFEPGHARDGVTITVPQAALRQISEDALGWLVPGLVEEKILHLIRSLPKSLRTNFVPAPDVAKKLAKELSTSDRTRGFLAVLCEAMSKHAGERIMSSSFAQDKLPQHLRMHVQVVDDQGAVIETGRDIPQLVSQYAAPNSSENPVSSDVQCDWIDKTVTPGDFDELPEQYAIRRGGLVVAAFPALVDLGNSVQMRLSDTAADAERLTLGGLTRLFATKHHRLLRGHVAHLPNLTQCSVKLGHLIASKQLSQLLQDLIVRIALLDGQPLVRNRDDFDVRNTGATQQISIATQEVATWLPKLAEQVHQVRLLLEKPPSSWACVIDDVREQEAALLHTEFLSSTPWMWLKEIPRYLQSIRARIDKLTNGGVAKDQKLSEPVKVAVLRYQELCESQTQASTGALQLDEVRWLIEELRVSIYSQQLGTKVSVSPKRIEKMLDGLS